MRDSRLQLAALLCYMLVPVHFLEMDDKGGEILIKNFRCSSCLAYSEICTAAVVSMMSSLMYETCYIYHETYYIILYHVESM